LQNHLRNDSNRCQCRVALHNISKGLPSFSDVILIVDAQKNNNDSRCYQQRLSTQQQQEQQISSPLFNGISDAQLHRMTN